MQAMIPTQSCNNYAPGSSIKSLREPIVACVIAWILGIIGHILGYLYQP
jgi:hypothetical protein